MSKVTHYNAPIQLLDGFMDKSKKVLGDILDYAVYRHSIELAHGTPEQRFNDAQAYFGVTLHDNALANGQKLYERYVYKKPPFFGISRDVFWDFYKTDKSDFDKECLLAELALKSIIGSSPYIKTNFKIILYRMAAKVDTKPLDNKNVKSTKVLSKSEAKAASDKQIKKDLPECFHKYVQRYHFEKLRDSLIDNWYLKYWSDHNRGFYVSFIKDVSYLAEISIRDKNENVKAEKKLIKQQIKEDAQRAFDAKNRKDFTP